MTIESLQEDSTVTKPTKRMRWATQRLNHTSAHRKRNGIMGRFHKGTTPSEKKRDSGGTGSVTGSHVEAPHNILAEENGGHEVEEDGDSAQRRIFFNIPLPTDAKHEDGRPLEKFARNKIRTARYTPLSFVGKNLWYQLHNVANVYFLFLVILAFFPIFGASNPGLNAVPILVILLLTAIKDAIEDWRRTVLDNELNNSPVHRLVDWYNVNSSEDNISYWRRFKKATSRGIRYLIARRQHQKHRKSGDTKAYPERTIDETRPSTDTRHSIRTPVAISRKSVQSVDSGDDEGGIQMTPVPSPLPGDGIRKRPDGLELGERRERAYSYEGEEADTLTDGVNNALTPGESSKRQSAVPPSRFYGNLMDPLKQTPDKARFKKDFWKNVEVGDFVRIYNNDQIPADIAILSTSDPDGACYVETKNLDGETNLKVRQSLHSGRKIKHARDCERTEFVIESEPAHANLYRYSGVVKWTQKNARKPDDAGSPMTEPISINNVLLRGCSLRNTEWVLGVVLFAGLETKIMLNSGITPSKRSRMIRELNWNVIYNFGILLIMCIVSGIVNGVSWGQTGESLTFFDHGSIGNTPALTGFITFWTMVILFQNLVPISLYISLEIIKTAQAFFIYSDAFMYHEKLDYPCTPKSWNISDDLGQIEYIFSDKTGTLTQNVMEFKKCTINGVPYGEAYTEALAGLQKRQGIDVEVEGAKAHKQIAIDRIKMLEDLRKMHPNPYLRDEDLTFVAPDFVSDLDGAAGPEQKIANSDFMLALALCHTVITERTPGDPPRIEFKAQSPDEAALVATARDCGFTVIGRSNDGIILNVLGEEKEYEVLNTLEFNSSRKRMSAIIRMPDNRIMLFCKGADSIIYSRLKRGEQAQLRKETAEHLEMFAREGLRTLCIAQRELDEEEYQNWNKQHDLAAASVQDREDKLETVSDAIERDLSLIGGTAIEDRLQDGVPDTISLLGEAGIKLWVLTGDKVETAINIGFSCNLLDNDMDLIVLKVEDDTVEGAEALLDQHLAECGMTGSDQELAQARQNHEPPRLNKAVVIDGDALNLVLDEKLRQKFLILCKQCKSVLCCRVSPAQKASVVQMVKNGLDVMTLSIGDGANDVAMIQEADVGVGIAGEEGRQAVMSSDYAIGQFRFLQRLILVHGRWSYRRLAETIANFFYKNMVWTFAIFWYQLYCHFDGTYIFDYTYILLFNLAFTSVPIVFMGILDQDVSDKVSLAVPQLYRRGIERKEWTQLKFWTYMADGIYQSLVCFYIAYLLFHPGTFVTSNGLDVADRERMGVYIACATVVVVNLYILLNTFRWDWLMVLLVSVSSMLVFFWTGVYTAFPGSTILYKAAPQAYGQLSFWALSLLTIIISLLPRFTAKTFQKIFLPLDVDIVREQVRQGKYRYLDSSETPVTPGKTGSAASSDFSNHGAEPGVTKARTPVNEEERPIYPPSVALTATTHNNRSANGSDGTGYSSRPISRDGPLNIAPLSRPLSMDRPRPSFDRMRQSMDRIRPSFEASHDFTSAAMLTRMESSHSDNADAPNRRRCHGHSTLR